MLASTSKSDQASEDKRDPSYIFNGPVNTMAQGHPVPIGYGEMIVGSAVISAGISVDESPFVPGGPDWTNPVTGLEERYPAPTLIWDNNLGNWTLPDGTELLFDTQSIQTGYGWDTSTWEEVRSNFRTADGRVPALSTVPERWDIPNAADFATAKKIGTTWVWHIRGGSVPVYFSDANKRFETSAAPNYYQGEGGIGDAANGIGGAGPGGSAGDANGGEGGNGGGDGSGVGGGSGVA